MANTSVRGKYIPHLPAKDRGLLSVSEYVKKKEEYAAVPGRITKKGYFAFYGGKWIPMEEFRKRFPPPVVPNLLANKENPDKRQAWMND